VRAPSQSKPVLIESDVEGGDSSTTDTSLTLIFNKSNQTNRDKLPASPTPKKRNKPAAQEILLKVTEDFFKQLSIKPETSTSIKIGEEGYIFVILESLVLDLEKLMLEFFNSSNIPNSPGSNIEFPQPHILHLSK